VTHLSEFIEVERREFAVRLFDLSRAIQAAKWLARQKPVHVMKEVLGFEYPISTRDDLSPAEVSYP
jgi:hypothetical protein